MDKTYADAINYLSPPIGSFWTWDDQGAVVIWSSGSTIAFREELAVVLGRMSAQGLPSIDAVLLLIAATRAYWEEDSLPLQHRLRGSVVDQIMTGATRQNWSELFASLDTIHHLPDELIRTPESKADLATIVFEAAPRVVSADVAKLVSEVLAQRLLGNKPNLSQLAGGRVQTDRLLIHDLRALTRGLQDVTRQSLLLQNETGLETEPLAAPVEYLIDQPGVRSLLQQLADDEEFGGLSRLARNLAAVVQLPRSISDSDELPLGGVSDLTNRGPLDRLLLSELAHDDLMLAARVALNEALYYRREVPPSYPPERRHVLIDSGLRMWGVPRVFATAVALSLASTGGKDASLAAYRASQTNVIPVDLSTRDGLVAHLGSLETEAHPGKALSEFFDKVSQSRLPGDVILVTTEAVLDDPEFRRDFGDADAPTVYVATVNREGGLQLISLSSRGRKNHAMLRLDLDELLKPPQPKARRLIDSAIDPNSPAITRVRPFPFRLPYHFNSNLSKEVAWSFPIRRKSDLVSTSQNPDAVSDVILVSAHPRPAPRCTYGVVVLTRHRRLLLFDDLKKGALQLDQGLPFGKCLGSWSSDSGDQTFAVIYRESESAVYLLTVDLVDLTVCADPLPSKYLSANGNKSQILGALNHGGFIFIIFRSMIEVFDPTTKVLLDSTYSELPARWTCSRYFFNPAYSHNDAWFAMSFDGSSIGFQHVPLGKYAHPKPIRSLFDRRGYDGAFGVDDHGILMHISEQTETNPLARLCSDFTLFEVGADGRRILAKFVQYSKAGVGINVVDLESCTVSPVIAGYSLAHFDIAAFHRTPQPMRRFVRVSVEDEKITLVSKNAAHWTFAVKSNRLVMVAIGGKKCARLSQEIEPLNSSASTNLMSAVKWDDGSRLWIDARGLLHLQSSDRSIPEATFLLVVDGVTVWTSDGRMLGTQYYLDGDSSISPVEVIETILEPFVARLR